MAIRVLRIIEYVYADEVIAAADQARWTHSQQHKHMTMRSTALPFEAVSWEPFEDNGTEDDDGTDDVSWKTV